MHNLVVFLIGFYLVTGVVVAVRFQTRHAYTSKILSGILISVLWLPVFIAAQVDAAMFTLNQGE